VAHPRSGALIIDHHDRVFSGEGRHASLVEVLIGFHASGEGSRYHEILHYVIVPELVLDGVGMVWVHLLQEFLEVVCGWPRLTLAAAYSHHNACHAGAIRSLVVATIIVDCGCSLLKSLLAPVPTALGALPSILGGDFGRRPLLLLRAR
jgi:hypothetical protein